MTILKVIDEMCNNTHYAFRWTRNEELYLYLTPSELDNVSLSDIEYICQGIQDNYDEPICILGEYDPIIKWTYNIISLTELDQLLRKLLFGIEEVSSIDA